MLSEQTIPQLLEAGARKWPKNTALRDAEGEVSYAQLEARANQFAHALVSCGLAPGMRVGIHAEKSVATVIAMYGVLKAGAIYVPLHPTLPGVRLLQIVCDCEIAHLYVDETRAESSELAASLSTSGLRWVLSPAPDTSVHAKFMSGEQIAAFPDTALMTQIGAQDGAYILYTSGTTGTPKGIVHSHGSALAFVAWCLETFRPSERDRFSNHAPFQFDLSTFDLFVSLACGASVYLIPDWLSKLPACVAELIELERFTVWYSVPFALAQIIERGGHAGRDFDELRLILFAGEQAAVADIDRLRHRCPNARLANLYGPTETNVCTWYEIPSLDKAMEASIPIGSVCNGSDWLILDRDSGTAVQQGRGELLISGPTVMQGYWNAPALNAKCFYSGKDGRRYYRTGDLVESDAMCRFALVGRFDRQVKVRGYRIELEEVEQVIASHPAVCEVSVFTDAAANNGLVAAVSLREGCSASPDELRVFVSERLPVYAVPATIRLRESLPRTLTGKIDRSALVTATA